MHIQQIKLEIEEGEFHPEEQLEEAGSMPAGKMAEASLLEGEAKHQFSEEIAKLNFAAGWRDKATTNGENNMGDLVDLPICREELQQRRLQGQSQPLQ
jgi:hypothetical protein